MDVVVEKVFPADPQGRYSACIDGRRAGPPEDCGGPFGYAELLEVLADPADPRHGEYREWVGGFFDPEEFDPADFELHMRELRSMRRW